MVGSVGLIMVEPVVVASMDLIGFVEEQEAVALGLQSVVVVADFGMSADSVVECQKTFEWDSAVKMGHLVVGDPAAKRMMDWLP